MAYGTSSYIAPSAMEANNIGKGFFSGVGDMASALYQQALKEKEQGRLDAQLKLAQNADQRAADEVTRNELARKESVDYTNRLNSATSKGTISLGDQSSIGTRMAELGNQAEAARNSGDSAALSRIMAEQAKVVDSTKGMADSFQKSPEAKWDVINSIQAGPHMRPEVAASLHQSAITPVVTEIGDNRKQKFAIENSDRDHAYRMKQIEQQNAFSIALEKMKHQDALNQAIQAAQLKNMYYNPTTHATVDGLVFSKMSDKEREGFTNLDASKLVLDGQKVAMSGAFIIRDPNTGVVRPALKDEPGAEQVSVSALPAYLGYGNGYGGGHGNGSGGKTSSGSHTDLESAYNGLTNKGWDNANAARDSVSAATKLLNEAGIPKSIQDQMLLSAVDKGSSVSVVPWRDKVFDAAKFNDAFNSEVSAFFTTGAYKGTAGGVPTKTQLDNYKKLIAEGNFGAGGTGDGGKNNTSTTGGTDKPKVTVDVAIKNMTDKAYSGNGTRPDESPLAPLFEAAGASSKDLSARLIGNAPLSDGDREKVGLLLKLPAEERAQVAANVDTRLNALLAKYKAGGGLDKSELNEYTSLLQDRELMRKVLR